MAVTTDLLLSPAAELRIKGILEWLAVAHDREGSSDVDALYRQLLVLRDTPLPVHRRIRLLDLLHTHVERIVRAELPEFQKASLPLSRKYRQRVKLVVDLLENLIQSYFDALGELFDTAAGDSPYSPHESLLRAMRSIASKIKIYYLVASPVSVGLWQQLHAAFRTARRLNLENFPGPQGERSAQRTYMDILLAAIAHPASFSASELGFINDYIEGLDLRVDLSETPPAGAGAVFWIDPEQDVPAQALIRRAPAAGLQALYFTCDALAAEAARHRAELEEGHTALDLGLPAFADTRAGRSVLRRLVTLWSKPGKRRFPRRRHSYRASLCLGLSNLWRLIRNSGESVPVSEWMVTNESPDGFALMHVRGNLNGLRIGDVVALRIIDQEGGDAGAAWRICLIRWGISENAEHVELGLQLIAPGAIAAEIARPGARVPDRIDALLLTPILPLRPAESLLVPSGRLQKNHEPLVLLIENGNLLVREVKTGDLDEQTSSVEIFSVLPSAPA